MTIALFSDIHANLPALEAFFRDLESRNADAVYCLGDLVGYNVWPNEVIHEIRRRHIPTIAGNYDAGIGRAGDDCGCAYKTDQEKANGAVSIAYTNQLVGDDERKYLRSLPAHIRIEFQLNDDRLSLLLVHGSPRKVNEYLFEDREENSLRRMMQAAKADVMCFGHTHKPYHRTMEAIDEDGIRYLHAINTGSIGKPKDGDPRGCYVLLHINESSTKRNKEAVTVEFVRFTYDVEKAVRAVEESPLPDVYAECLRKGI